MTCIFICILIGLLQKDLDKNGLLWKYVSDLNEKKDQKIYINLCL